MSKTAFQWLYRHLANLGKSVAIDSTNTDIKFSEKAVSAGGVYVYGQRDAIQGRGSLFYYGTVMFLDDEPRNKAKLGSKSEFLGPLRSD